MSVPSVTLSGSALTGVAPELLEPHLLAALPRKVRLGCWPPRPLFRPLAFADYFQAAALTTPPPAATSWRTKAAPALARVYLNDRLGDCVIAGKAHALGIWSANDSDAPALVLATDAEIEQQYHAWCGAGDNGCIITDVLDAMRSRGFMAGGQSYPLDGYVAVDWTNALAVRVVLAVFGAATIGINLPAAWTQDAVWDITNSPIVGGHDVTCCDYDDSGVYVSSWGRIYLITWAAFTSRRWLSEMYALLAPLWYGRDNLAPSGIDAALLRRDLEQLGQGTVPNPGPGPGPGPEPVPPPEPPPEALFYLTWKKSVRAGSLERFRAPCAIPAGRYGVVPAGAHALIGSLTETPVDSQIWPSTLWPVLEPALIACLEFVITQSSWLTEAQKAALLELLERWRARPQISPQIPEAAADSCP